LEQDEVSDIMSMTAEEIGPVPWQCWDVPGFKACNTEAGHRAHRALRAAGATPGSPEWDAVYPNQVRREIVRCEILSNCQADTIKRQLTEMETAGGGSSSADILKRLDSMQPQQESSNMKWVALALGVGVVFFAYTRMKA
jgi:hypothetical protein